MNAIASIDRDDALPDDQTPEQKALIARKALCSAVRCLILCAHGNGVTDDRLKRCLLALRAPDISILSDDEAAELIEYLELNEA